MKSTLFLIGIVLLVVFLALNFGVFQIDFIARLINVLLISAALVTYRIIFGPSAADRLVAVDIIGVLIVGLLALLTLHTGAHFFLDIAIAWSLQSFIVSLALAKYLENRKIDD
ncbi:MAG TPA: monovalent cation/H+ antiporter complex subunit F [Atribacteraceae bacterium]|nr:monovalent cation/H+ antiporter complex subunit F [Atribacteraceae bacterium]